MKSKSIQAVVWENVSALMKAKWGAENVNRLARDAKIGIGGAQRIKAGKNYGVSTVERVAVAFKVEPWALLVEGLRVDATPKIDYVESTELTAQQKEKVRKALEEITPGQLDMLIDSGELRKLLTGPHYPVEKMGPEWDASSKRKR